MKRKPFFQYAAGLLAGVILFFGITQLLNRMYVEEDAQNRILWHNFYEDCGKIDDLYLGSSHVYFDLDPQILDQLNGQYHFNLSSSSQPLDGSYYLLREADRLNDLNHVYLEMYYLINSATEGPSVAMNWYNTDHMKLSANKIAYMLSLDAEDQYIGTLFPFTRYRQRLGDWTYITQRLEEKRGDDYHNFQYECENGRGYESVEKQGYRKSTWVYTDNLKHYRQNTVLSGYSMGGENEAYCRRIITYCQDHELPLTLFVAPIYDLQLISTVDYDDYVEEIRALAKEYSVPFYDFNLAKEEYLPFQDSRYFRDEEHLNQEGASLFTALFHEVMTAEDDVSEKYFYDSYAEKLRTLPPAVYGLYDGTASNKTEKKAGRVMYIASNRDSDMEYQVMITPENEEPYLLQDFSENKELYILSGGSGQCLITARMKGSSEIIQTITIQYY